MPANSIFSEEAVQAHTEILKPENYHRKEVFEKLIDRICESVTFHTIGGILHQGLTTELVKSFDGYEGILEDVQLCMVNLWVQAQHKSELPTILVCGQYVPAVCPFYSADMSLIPYFDFTLPIHSPYEEGLFDSIYQDWIRNLEDEVERVKMAEPESAVRSMKKRLFEHVRTRLLYYYNTRNHLEAIGVPYSNTKLRVKFKSPTKGARVMYTPIYNYSPQYANGLTSPATAYMDPGTYELRISPATGLQKKEPNPYGIHHSQTIIMTV